MFKEEKFSVVRDSDSVEVTLTVRHLPDATLSETLKLVGEAVGETVTVLRKKYLTS